MASEIASPFVNREVPAVLKSAKWIWAKNHQFDLYNCYALFRRRFQLAQVPAAAKLAITADQSYQLYVNGNYVCRGPARGFQSHWPYDEVDIASWLVAGENVLAVRAYNPGVSNFQYVCAGFAGLLAGLEIDGEVIVTDRTWRCRRQEGVSRDTVPVSLQLFPQEHIDLRIEDPDWMRPTYDDSVCPLVNYTHPWNAMPWPSLELRGIPMLREKLVSTFQVIGTMEGDNAPDYLSARDIMALRHSEGLDFSPVTAKALGVPVRGAGKFSSRLIDFGKTVVGCLELGIAGAAGGEVIDAVFCETIAEDALRPDVMLDTHCRLALGSRMICRSGSNNHRFYHPMGFRYLILTIRDVTVPEMELDISLHNVGYPLRRNGGLETSDGALAAIWETCAWTQECCSLDAYVDTPWREQAQWWGDARVQGWNTFHLDGDARLFRRGIHCIASQTTPDGVTYGHSPTIGHECVLPDFTLIWFMTIWDYYWQTGSTEPFTSHLPVIERALDYFESRLGEYGLLRDDDRYWVFLDWSDVFKDGYSAIYNLWYYLALKKLARLADLSGRPELATLWRSKMAKLGEALVSLQGEDGLYRDGRHWDGALVESSCVQTQTLAIMTGLAGEGREAMLELRLAPIGRGEVLSPTPSAYWITYVYSALIESGYEEDVITTIAERWAPMVQHGTTWEGFTPRRGHESFSHAWSAHPLFHLMATIGGLRQTAPGWKEILFKPIFHGNHGGAIVPSPQGPIHSHWERLPTGKVKVQLTLPEGVEARVQLPSHPEEAVIGTAHWTIGFTPPA